MRDERERLAFARDAALLSEADRAALIAHYAVSYAYDGRDNLWGAKIPSGAKTGQADDLARSLGFHRRLKGRRMPVATRADAGSMGLISRSR